MHKFKRVSDMVEAMKRDEIPSNVVSPGAAAAALGITRQSLHALLKRGSLPAWWAEGMILVDADAVQARCRDKAGVSPGQGALV